MRRRRGPLRLGLVLAATFASGLGAGLVVADPPEARAAGREPYAAIARFTRAFHFVYTRWVGDPDPDRLVDAAIGAMVASLDQHSRFASRATVDALEVPEARAAHAGVALVLGADGWRVAAVAPDGPAQRMGLAEGDRLVALDRQPIASLAPEQVVARLVGPPGSVLEVEVSRPAVGGGPTRVVAPLLRQVGLEPSVVGRRLAGGVVHVAIRTFVASTPRELTRALERLRREGSWRGLVLDLRGNTGGLVDAAIAAADVWLAEGTILTTRARGREPVVARAHPKGTEPTYPMVVLVDERTASASEALAAALRDHGRARLVGRRTFGKASVQTTLELDDGSLLRLTTARYYTPSDRFLEGEGLTPDVELAAAPAGPSAAPAPSAGGSSADAAGATPSSPTLAVAPRDDAEDAALERARALVTHGTTTRGPGSFTVPEARAISQP